MDAYEYDKLGNSMIEKAIIGSGTIIVGAGTLIGGTILSCANLPKFLYDCVTPTTLTIKNNSGHLYYLIIEYQTSNGIFSYVTDTDDNFDNTVLEPGDKITKYINAPHIFPNTIIRKCPRITMSRYHIDICNHDRKEIDLFDFDCTKNQFNTVLYIENDGVYYLNNWFMKKKLTSL